jgi:hypothetical protein
MKRIINLALCLFIASAFNQALGQQRINRFIDLTGTIGSSQGSAAFSYVHNWKLWKKQKFEIGIGARWTTYSGSKKDFLTAGPAKYTRSFTAPFLIFFAGQNEENFDTLAVQRPLTHSLNLTANLGYNISPKWYAGFNIDVIGFTLGRKTAGVFTSDGETMIDQASKPAAFNLLLTGDHDLGTLNSEFFVKYKIGNRWHLKAVYQFMFIEYETQSVKQQIPNGPQNDRFRNKANNVGLGIAHHF